MPCCMPRRFKDLCLCLAQLETIAFHQLDVNARNSGCILARPGDPATGRLLKLNVATRVIRMMVSREYPIQRPSPGRESFLYRCRHCGIDHTCGPARRIVDQIDIIVAENRDHLDGKQTHGRLRRRFVAEINDQ